MRTQAKKYWWTSSCGRVELYFLSLADAESCAHAGRCDDDVAALAQVPYMTAQLAAIDPAKLAQELSEYGAWDADELADHAQNLQRVLWIAANDVTEYPEEAAE